MRIQVAALVILAGLSGLARAQTVPVANAGPDVAVACVAPGGTPINLNGMGSSIGADFSYLWTAPGGTFNDPTSLTPIGVFPVGTTEVTFDSTPPMISASPNPSVLWPPNHKLHDINVDVLVFDACDANPAVELVSIMSSEPDNGTGDGNTPGDIQGADLGSDDRAFQLRAERSGPGSGRTYSALYRVTDGASNHSDFLVTVLVPHDMGHHGGGSDDSAMHQAEQQIKAAQKAAVKAAKAQLKAAKQAEKAAKKAYKAALKAAD